MTTRHEFYLRGHSAKVSNDADQTELVALRLGSARAVAGVRDDDISDSLEDHYASTNVEDETVWQTRESSIDNAATQIIEELSRRQEALGDLYPYKLEGDVLTYEQSQTQLYEFLLCTSQSPNLTSGAFVRFPRNFERVAARVSADFLGHNTKFSHIGAPSDRGNLKASAQEAIEASRELKWSPTSDLPDAGPPSGDQGVDYIIWREFGCGRHVGKPFYFGQCACGNDWDTKLNDISDRFFQWFEKLRVQPTKIFAVPFVVPENKLNVVSKEAGIVMDRLRMVLAADEGNKFNGDEWRDELFDTLCLVAAA